MHRVFVSVFVTLLLFVGGCISSISTGQESILTEIETANHCTVKLDCQQVESQCPFGCYVFVHKNEAANIERLIRDYKSTCDYGCMALKDYNCVQNKCIAFYE